jgi:hypothetical protein
MCCIIFVGEDSVVEMRGSKESSTNPLLQKGLSLLNSPVIVQGIKEQAIIAACLRVSDYMSVTVENRFEVFNPMDIPIILRGIANFHVYVDRVDSEGNVEERETFGRVEAHTLKKPILLLPRQRVKAQEWVSLSSNGGIGSTLQLLRQLSFSPYYMPLHMEGQLDLLIDEFEMKVNCAQSNVIIYWESNEERVRNLSELRHIFPKD